MQSHLTISSPLEPLTLSSDGTALTRLDFHAARAVGSAVGRNPIPILIPCHRVIGVSGALTGFTGGQDIKKSTPSTGRSAFGGTSRACIRFSRLF